MIILSSDQIQLFSTHIKLRTCKELKGKTKKMLEITICTGKLSYKENKK